jgi:tRNA(Ile)-lysidine synthase TilS/MesJ
METAAYGFLKGIDYVTEECPMSHDATSLVYKEALSLIEEKMPGTRSRFYLGFLESKGTQSKGTQSKGTFLSFSEEGPAVGRQEGAEEPLAKCTLCGAPSYAETCAFCRLKEKVGKGGNR